jgi:hypothetical protein
VKRIKRKARARAMRPRSEERESSERDRAEERGRTMTRQSNRCARERACGRADRLGWGGDRGERGGEGLWVRCVSRSWELR